MSVDLKSDRTNEWLFGWDDTSGIVSVWAERSGRALVWRRIAGQLICEESRFQPFLFAANLDDLAHLGHNLVPADAPNAHRAAVRYQALAGDEQHTYRYLLFATDLRSLERTIVQGASRRLNRKVERITSLDEYYTLGPIEQYLMQTGRVYFRGMVYADLHRLQFDLETTSLRPEAGRIFLVAVRDSSGFEAVLEAPHEADEARLIADLCALISDRNPDIIENHNLFGFDLPFLYHRASVLKVPLLLGRTGAPPLLSRYDEPNANRHRRRTRYSIGGRELIDTLDATFRHDFSMRDMPGYGLKAVARYFGVASPDRTYIPGYAIYRTYATDPERVRRYALDDVREVDALSARLMGAAFALSGMAPRPYERVASAGPAMGILEPMLVRAYLRAAHALPRNSSDSDGNMGRHSGGATYLFAGGLARHVVKADIASMYPSIMRVYQIGPSCDKLGVLLNLVARLTDLRLEHKQAARVAVPGSVAAMQHGAVQAAMKIMINSAYGYLGAGSMALFADRAAADKITSTGRAILDQVVAALRERGMGLLEGDTDGVYFSTPQYWTEAEERQLVAEVAALLPKGIRLEYEARYQAMLCHEVKNYALLTYDDKLIMRGGALRSSRSEPFGVRFLVDAVGCLLREDIAGLLRVYADIVAALREHRLPIAEVASRTRLFKSAEDYQRTRPKLREAQYEALIAAGRKEWRVGERIRFYRAADGRALWLPDEQDNEDAISDEQDEVAAAALPAALAEASDDMPHDYDSAHYLRVLHTSYVSRLRKAFREPDFNQLFRNAMQLGLFDQPLADITPLWIEASDKLRISDELRRGGRWPSC